MCDGGPNNPEQVATQQAQNEQQRLQQRNAEDARRSADAAKLTQRSDAQRQGTEQTRERDGAKSQDKARGQDDAKDQGKASGRDRARADGGSPTRDGATVGSRVNCSAPGDSAKKAGDGGPGRGAALPRDKGTPAPASPETVLIQLKRALDANESRRTAATSKESADAPTGGSKPVPEAPAAPTKDGAKPEVPTSVAPTGEKRPPPERSLLGNAEREIRKVVHEAPGTIGFGFGDRRPAAGHVDRWLAERTLNERIALASKDTVVRIWVGASRPGSGSYNQQLSEARGAAIVRALEARGVSASFDVVALGESEAQGGRGTEDAPKDRTACLQIDAANDVNVRKSATTRAPERAESSATRVPSAPAQPGTPKGSGVDGERSTSLPSPTRQKAEVRLDKATGNPEGGRGDGHLANDWAGRLIVSRWFTGQGDWTIKNDPDWTRYMTKHPRLQRQVAERVGRIATQLASSGAKGEVSIRDRFQGFLQNGEGMVGYQYLHGTNANTGHFTLGGRATVTSAGDSKRVTFDMTSTWNDRIDPNEKYATDIWKSTLAKAASFGMAKDYDIRISWKSKFTAIVDRSGKVTFPDGGWPAETPTSSAVGAANLFTRPDSSRLVRNRARSPAFGQELSRGRAASNAGRVGASRRR